MSRAAILSGMFSTSEQLEMERIRALYRRLSALERAVAIDVQKGPTLTDSTVYTLVPDGTGSPSPTTIINGWQYAGSGGVRAGQIAYIMIDYSISADPTSPSTYAVAAFYFDHTPTSVTDWPATYGFLGGVSPGYRTGLSLWPGRNMNTMPNTMGKGGGFFAIPIKADGVPSVSVRAFNPRISGTPTLITQNTARITDITARAFITG